MKGISPHIEGRLYVKELKPSQLLDCYIVKLLIKISVTTIILS